LYVVLAGVELDLRNSNLYSWYVGVRRLGFELIRYRWDIDYSQTLSVAYNKFVERRSISDKGFVKIG
jgi:hypothetical protein